MLDNYKIEIAGKQYPYPSRTSGLQTQGITLQTSAMLNGSIRARVIGRATTNITLKWSLLDPDDWSQLCNDLAAGSVEVKYFDAFLNQTTTRTFVSKTASAAPFAVDELTGKPRYWESCTITLEDLGVQS